MCWKFERTMGGIFSLPDSMERLHFRDEKTAKKHPSGFIKSDGCFLIRHFPSIDAVIFARAVYLK